MPACRCCAWSLCLAELPVSVRQCELDWACVASGKANTIPPEPYTGRERTHWVLVCTLLSADLVLPLFYSPYFPRCRVETINPPAVSPLLYGDHRSHHLGPGQKCADNKRVPHLLLTLTSQQHPRRIWLSFPPVLLTLLSIARRLPPTFWSSARFSVCICFSLSPKQTTQPSPTHPPPPHCSPTPLLPRV